MKKWNTPEIAELNIEQTANGFLSVDWEGPFGIVFGDKSNEENKKPSTTEESM